MLRDGFSDLENKLCDGWRLFPRASPASFRREGTIGRFATGLSLCHFGRGGVRQRVAVCGVRWRSGIVVALERVSRDADQRVVPARELACLVPDSRVGVKEVFRVIFPPLV